MNQNNLCGVYLIKNNINHKFYVGSTYTSFEKRWHDHNRKLKRNKHINKHLQSAWNLYGETNFEFIILEITSPENAVIREQYHMDTLIPEYNLTSTANSVRGYRHTDESKQKMRIAKIGKVTWNIGRKIKDSSKQLMRERKLGRKLSQEHKNNISKAIKNADLTNTIIATKKRQNKKVYCVELDITFESMLAAADYLKLNYDHMTFCIKNNKKVKNYTLKRVYS